MFRVLVGTLSCGEAELDEARRVIAAQEGVQVEHVLYSDLPELEAHRRLFSLWNERRQDFDLFVKVDGDTILCRPTALREICDLFAGNPQLTGAQIGLLDYFSDQMIAGLNCFSPAVSFGIPDDPLYCDRMAEIGHRLVLKPQDTQSLFPIGWHCRYPTRLQAFHYGYRRMLKGQRDYISAMLAAFRAQGGEGRLWALHGVREAFFRQVADASYGNPEFAAIFAAAERAFTAGRRPAESILADAEGILAGDLGLRLRRRGQMLLRRFG